MSYAQVVYKAEIQDIIKNFKEALLGGHLPEFKETRDILVFLTLFNQSLDNKVNQLSIYDLRNSLPGNSFYKK